MAAWRHGGMVAWCIASNSRLQGLRMWVQQQQQQHHQQQQQHGNKLEATLVPLFSAWSWEVIAWFSRVIDFFDIVDTAI
jgi:hypothetical protein